MQNTLIALSLALREPNLVLTDQERSVLREVGFKLALRDDAWEFVREDLMGVIFGNTALNRLYQVAKAQLDTLENDIILHLLPNEAELAELSIIKNTGSEVRGDFEEKRKKRDYLTNSCIYVLKSPEIAKELSIFKRIQGVIQQLKQPII